MQHKHLIALSTFLVLCAFQPLPAWGRQSGETAHTHVTAPTQFVEANGVRYAYRRFGNEAGVPLVFLQHFRGGLDHRDPAVTDPLARDRPVILFDNAGVGASTGKTPSTIRGMADHVASFVEALGLQQVDIFGFSMGGTVAQEFALNHPQRVRRLLLVGTAPEGGEGLGLGSKPDVAKAATNPVNTREDFLFLFFAPSSSSQAAGRAFWERRHLRKIDVDPETRPESYQAMGAASEEWAKVKGERYARLKQITQPVLVVNGHNDIMVPTYNSYLLQQHLPNARLILYPDSGHASQYQYPELFTDEVIDFLR